MNIYELISTAITNINATADLTFKEKSRAEADTQNYKRANINILNEISGTKELQKNTQLKSSTRYIIDFLQLDEWDNADYNETQANQGSFQIVEEMSVLSNSIFSNIVYKQDLYLPTENKINWTFTQQFRVNANTMSGVRCTITLPFIDTVVCDYDLI